MISGKAAIAKEENERCTLRFHRGRMRIKNKKPLRRKIVLRLPDLDRSKSAVLNYPGISRPCALSVLPDCLKSLKYSANWQFAIGHYLIDESLDRKSNSNSPSYVSAPTVNAFSTSACVTSLATLRSDSWASTKSPSAMELNAPISTAALTWAIVCAGRHAAECLGRKPTALSPGVQLQR